MRNTLYLAFCLVLAVGVGCAVTDYETIIDNDQISPKAGSGSGGSKVSKKVCNQCIVDTKGKAHIDESSQVAFSDGSGGFDETLWMVDQKADGTRKLYTYNNYSDASGPTFHDDLYCNTAFSKCAIWTSTDPPGEFGSAAFDGVGNANCRGYQNLSFLTSTSRYYGECGKARSALTDRIALVNMGRFGSAFGMDGLFYDLNHSNVTLTLDNNAGFVTTLPMTASAVAFAGTKGDNRSVVDASNPLFGSMARTYADFLRDYATDRTTVTITYNGISNSFLMAGNQGVSNPSRVLENANRWW